MRRGPKRTFANLRGGLVELQVMDHYNCRGRNGVQGAKLSTHAKGKAIDIGGFKLADGTVVSVLDHWRHPTYGRQLLQPHALVSGSHALWIVPKGVTAVATVEAANSDLF